MNCHNSLQYGMTVSMYDITYGYNSTFNCGTNR